MAGWAPCLSFAALNRGDKDLPHLISSSFFSDSQLGMEAPRLPSRVWAAFPAHNHPLSSLGDWAAWESGRRFGGFLTWVYLQCIWKQLWSSKGFPGCAPSSVEQCGCRKQFQPSDVKQFCSGRVRFLLPPTPSTPLGSSLGELCYCIWPRGPRLI